MPSCAAVSYVAAATLVISTRLVTPRPVLATVMLSSRSLTTTSALVTPTSMASDIGTINQFPRSTVELPVNSIILQFPNESTSTGASRSDFGSQDPLSRLSRPAAVAIISIGFLVTIIFVCVILVRWQVIKRRKAQTPTVASRPTTSQIHNPSALPFVKEPASSDSSPVNTRLSFFPQARMSFRASTMISCGSRSLRGFSIPSASRSTHRITLTSDARNGMNNPLRLSTDTYTIVDPLMMRNLTLMKAPPKIVITT